MVDDGDVEFINGFIQNVRFLPTLFSSACQLHTLVCESSLSASATTQLLDVLSFIPSLRNITLHSLLCFFIRIMRRRGVGSAGDRGERAEAGHLASNRA